MAMISVECPDCGRVLMRLPATGGTNQNQNVHRVQKIAFV